MVHSSNWTVFRQLSRDCGRCSFGRPEWIKNFFMHENAFVFRELLLAAGVEQICGSILTKVIAGLPFSDADASLLQQEFERLILFSCSCSPIQGRIVQCCRLTLREEHLHSAPPLFRRIVEE